MRTTWWWCRQTFWISHFWLVKIWPANFQGKTLDGSVKSYLIKSQCRPGTFLQGPFVSNDITCLPDFLGSVTRGLGYLDKGKKIGGHVCTRTKKSCGSWKLQREGHCPAKLKARKPTMGRWRRVSGRNVSRETNLKQMHGEVGHDYLMLVNRGDTLLERRIIQTFREWFKANEAEEIPEYLIYPSCDEVKRFTRSTYRINKGQGKYTKVSKLQTPHGR